MDLFVIGGVSFGEVVTALASVQSVLGREINPSMYSTREFRSKLRARHHFLTSLMKEPLQFVIGGPGDLEHLGAKRLGTKS